MERKPLRTALFGFSKADVCEYIARVNDECNERLNALADEHKKENEEWKAKNAALEAELEEYRRVHGDVAQALLDAQNYAAELRAKAEEEYRVMSDNIRLQTEKENARLKEYTESIDAVRKALAVFSSETDEKAQSVEQTCFTLYKKYNPEEGSAV